MIEALKALLEDPCRDHKYRNASVKVGHFPLLREKAAVGIVHR